LVLNVDFAPVDVQFLNNDTVRRARTEYEDFPEPERRRDLIALLLARPIPTRRVGPCRR
jgi:hypothetical protein